MIAIENVIGAITGLSRITSSVTKYPTPKNWASPRNKPSREDQTKIEKKDRNKQVGHAKKRTVEGRDPRRSVIAPGIQHQYCRGKCCHVHNSCGCFVRSLYDDNHSEQQIQR